MTLSKSQYIRALQCKKSIWLYKNRPELRDMPDSSQKSLFSMGYSVGDAAKELFSDGVEIEFDSDNFSRMAEKTKELIKSGTKTIYEATFRENNIFAMVDILVKNGDKWDIIEVKSSTSVKEYHLDDAAIQWYALKSVLNLNKIYILHVNNTYERDGKLELDKLFVKTDITNKVLEKQDTIPNTLKKIDEVLQGSIPIVKIGLHCDDPFSCDFYSTCFKDSLKADVFTLYRMNWSKKYKLFHKGIKSFHKLPKNLRLNKTQQIQLQTHETQEPFIDKNIIKEFLNTIKYPINFFDFETFMEAIPRYSNQKPYMQMPFQYSLHVLHEDGKLEHHEFLADETKDPRHRLIKKMLQDITPNGSIVAYNQSFEISRLKELAIFYTNKEEELLGLVERFVDLITPFRNLGYYHPNFKGSFSIKAVLPAMFPNNKELNYKNLGSVQNGSDAMDTYASLHLLKDETKKEQIREDLLAYCKLDTLAMVRLYERLCETVKLKTIE